MEKLEKDEEFQKSKDLREKAFLQVEKDAKMKEWYEINPEEHYGSQAESFNEVEPQAVEENNQNMK